MCRLYERADQTKHSLTGSLWLSDQSYSSPIHLINQRQLHAVSESRRTRWDKQGGSIWVNHFEKWVDGIDPIQYPRCISHPLLTSWPDTQNALSSRITLNG